MEGGNEKPQQPGGTGNKMNDLERFIRQLEDLSMRSKNVSDCLKHHSEAVEKWWQSLRSTYKVPTN